MEPIFKNPHFSHLLRIWKFLSTYHNFIGMADKYSQMSLYQLEEHLISDQRTHFVDYLIRDLARKLVVPSFINNKFDTSLMLAKFNKHNIFQEVLQNSAFELCRQPINMCLDYHSLERFSEDKKFQQLSIDERYKFFGLLIDMIQTGPEFQTYIKNTRTEYLQKKKTQSDKTKILQLDHEYLVKLQPCMFLGTSNGHLYYYLPLISDHILTTSIKKSKWSSIEGPQALKQLCSTLVTSPKISQITLLQNILSIHKFLTQQPTKSIAFNKQYKIEYLLKEYSRVNRVQILKEKILELQQQYSRFISDCYNFRWADKSRRRQFREEIGEAVTTSDVFTAFKSFYEETKFSAYKKVNNMQFYDIDLATRDVEPKQFKHAYLFANFIYSIKVFSDISSPTNWTSSISPIIKSLFQNPQNCENHYQLLLIFTLNMTQIVKQLYPKCYQKRLRLLANMSKQIQTQQDNKGGKRKLKGFVKVQVQSDQEEEGEDSVSTVQRNSQLKDGRRLRNKARVIYTTNNSNSTSKTNFRAQKKKEKLKPVKPVKSKVSKRTKMMLSDSQDDDSSNQDNSSVNLNEYVYVNKDTSANFRRSLQRS